MKKHNIKTKKERVSFSKIKLLSGLSLVFGFADALLIYVISSYFQRVSGVDNISPFYLVIFAIVLACLAYLHVFIRTFGKSVLLAMLFGILIVTNAALMMLPDSWWSIFFLMLHLVVVNLTWVSLDIILESFSTDSRSGRIRGLYLTIVNIGFVVAPVAASRILDRFDFQGLFLVEFIVTSTMLFAVLLGLRGINQRFDGEITPRQILRKVRRKKDVLRAYHISFAIEFFYAVMIVYTPIHMRNLGMSWDEIGIVFSIMLIPFVLVSYPLGLLADKKFGEKEMLIIALLLTGVSSGLVMFVASTKVWVWAVTLFATRLGVASVEILRDSYFYKRINGSDVDIIAFFRTARPVANIIAAVLAGIVLLVLPLPSVFALVAINAFISLFSAVTLQDNASERELAAEAAS